MRQNAPCEGRCGRDHARLLASQGRHGDTLVAHISPLEAAILRLLGGSGTINPKTGLPEFYNSSAGGDNGAGTGKADRDAANKGNALGGGRSSGSGKDDGSGGSYNGGGSTTSTSSNASPGLGGAYARLGNGLGLNGQPAPGGAPVSPDTAMAQRAVAQPGFNASPYAKGLAMALDVTGIGAPLGTIIGIADSLGAFDDIGGVSITDARDAARGSTGSNSGGGIRGGGGRGDSGSLPGNHAAIAQNAQQANAGGGLLPAPNSQPAPAPIASNLPIGLLQYLAQNPGLLQGLATQSRFGAGSVAPISYMRPYP